MNQTTKNHQAKTSSAEPFFYFALVLSGSEEQNVDLLKYMNYKNGSPVIYQTKSLTYQVSREDCTKLRVDLPDLFPSLGVLKP